MMMEGGEKASVVFGAVSCHGDGNTAAPSRVNPPGPTHNLLLLTWLVTSDLLSWRDCLA